MSITFCLVIPLQNIKSEFKNGGKTKYFAESGLHVSCERNADKSLHTDAKSLFKKNKAPTSA